MVDLTAFADVPMQMLANIARFPGFWRARATERRESARRLDDGLRANTYDAWAKEYDAIASALERGEPLPASAAEHLMPAVCRTVR